MRKIVANRLRELMARKGRAERRRISQRLVAEETGLDKTTIDRYARNEVGRFDEHVIVALCNYFECEIGGPNGLLVFEEVPDEDTPEFKNPATYVA